MASFKMSGWKNLCATVSKPRRPLDSCFRTDKALLQFDPAPLLGKIHLIQLLGIFAARCTSSPPDAQKHRVSFHALRGSDYLS